MAQPGFPGGVARPCAARSVALAGYGPRAAPASPALPALDMAGLCSRAAAGLGMVPDVQGRGGTLQPIDHGRVPMGHPLATRCEPAGPGVLCVAYRAARALGQLVDSGAKPL